MKKTTPKQLSPSALYDYSGTAQREETIEFLLEYAALSRSAIDEYWKRMRAYYDGKHETLSSAALFCGENSLPWLPAQSTDGYLHVETQISPAVPDFEFSPRDRTDYDKAKQREEIVRYICDNNDLSYKNSRNERRLGIDGSAVWKVCWDGNADFGMDKGEVTVLSPKPYEIYPDPTATDVDSCEYIGYVYRMHKAKAARIFEEDMKKMNASLSDYLDERAFDKKSYDSYDSDDDTVTVTEWWFRQTQSGSMRVNVGKESVLYEWKPGDIGLCVLINGKEVRYIPKYWRKTGFDCYPFVLYSRIPNDKSIWGKSELEAIIPLIDAKDRELIFAQLNSAYSSNDIILMEENALSDGETLDNSPGAVWKLRPGMMGKVARLGNLASAENSLYSGASFWQSLIESTTGNFEVNQGKEPTGVTTATGIALLNERAESRKNLKSIDRNAGFKRLFELIDKTSLEFYNDGRVIRLGLSGEDEYVYSFGGFLKKTREKKYIPAVDVTVHTGSAISNSKAFTVSALSTLMNMKINEDNYKLVKAYIETIGIPERAELCSYLDEKFGKGEMSEISAEDIMKILEASFEKGEENND
ncbi:MAG: hypothetical protein IJW06_01380 [Clostridia bacterium]|nr:hypothetical protein [Clostridia bacterium]